jgi:ABC-2 type transport system permease protein
MTHQTRQLHSSATARENSPTRLVRRGSTPGLRGFTTMWGKEQGDWWRTRRWLAQVTLWVVLLDGAVLAQLLDAQSGGAAARTVAFQDAADMFFVLGLLSSAVGIIVTLQGSVAGEVGDGTASWLLSKPLSRTAYLLAKLAAGTLGFLLVAVLAPAAVFVVEVRAVEGDWPMWAAIMPPLAVWAGHVTFYVALMLLLGVLLKRPAATAGTAVMLLVGGQIALGSEAVPLPWSAPTLAGDIASHQTDASAALLPISITLACSVLLLAAAVWRFSRTEL